MIVIVGAALVRDGRLLAARRISPPEAAGRWEFPGGKVDPGETADAAVVREVTEELGCEARVEQWLEGGEPVGESGMLLVAVCRLVEGEPAAGDDHDALCWLRPDELDDVDWLEPDRPFLPAAREVLLGWEA